MADYKYLNYTGLKTLVDKIKECTPAIDGVTIIRNSEGQLCTNKNIKPIIDETSGSIIFSDSPVEVSSGGSLIF